MLIFFVVLPGGYGTLDEMFDVIASGIIGEYSKPMFLVNENGFFDHFFEELEWMKSEKCIPENENYKINIVRHTDECIGQIINLINKLR